MTRTGLLIALAIAAAVGIVFGLYPKLDILLEQPFVDPSRDPTGLGFWLRLDTGGLDTVLNRLRDLGRLIVTFTVAPAVIALAIKIILPRRPMRFPARAAILMVYTLLLGPGVLTHLIMKDHWGRPRPVDVTEFGGDQRFVPWWDPRGDCPENCSFVAGEPSGAFWTLAAAAVAPPPWRPLAYVAAIAFGSVIGLIRMAGGGHFFSDVVFAGVFNFLIIWVAHGLLYRWRPTRLTDRTIERHLELLTLPFRGARPSQATAPPAAASGPHGTTREGE